MIEKTIEGLTVRLRQFRETDADEVATACADPQTQRFIPSMPSPYTLESAQWWITSGAPDTWATGGAVYAITDLDTDRLLGGIGLGPVSLARKQAEIGYWVAPWARRRGIATTATNLLASRALGTVFGRLELLTELENGASQRVALAAGFSREGVRRGAGVGRDGGRYDLLVWTRLVGDPPGPTARLLPDFPDAALTDGMVTVRRLAPADAEFLHGLHSMPEVTVNRVPPVPVDRAEIDLRCARAETRWLTGERADLVILDTATGEPIGACALFYADPSTGQATIGYSVSPAWRGAGVATRTVRLLARWAFDEAGIARLAAGTRTENVASQRVLTGVGFQRDGLLRGRYPGTDGQRVDELRFGLLPADLRRS